jgi:hypothetical protein
MGSSLDGCTLYALANAIPRETNLDCLCAFNPFPLSIMLHSKTLPTSQKICSILEQNEIDQKHEQNIFYKGWINIGGISNTVLSIEGST